MFRGLKIYVLLIMMVALFLWQGFSLFPWISDDITYRLPFKAYFLEGEGIDFNTLADSLLYRYNHDNGRLANLAMYALQWFPQSSLSLLSAIVCALGIYFALKIIGLQKSTPATALLSAAYILFLPWVDQLYVFNYQLNYLWAGTLMLAGAWVALENKGNKGGWAFFLIIGAWQEAASLPLLIALGVLFIFYKDYRSKHILIYAATLAAGLAWLFIVPGAREYRAEAAAMFSFRMGILLVFAAPAALYALLCAIELVRHRSLPPCHALLLAIALSSALIMLFIPAGPRLGTPSVLAAIAGITAFICSHKSKIVNALAFVAYGFAIIHLQFVFIYSMQENRVYRDVIRQYQWDPEEPIYASFTLRENAPLITMQKPYFDTYAHYSNIDRISRFYYTGPDSAFRYATVLPAALKNINEEEMLPLGDGFHAFRGLILGPPMSDTPAIVWLNADGTPTEYFTTPFTDSSGTLRAWYHPNRATLAALLHPLPSKIHR